MDLTTHLPETKDGSSAIIVFAHRLSKLVRTFSAKTSTDAKDYAYLVVREIFAKHGLSPNSTVSEEILGTGVLQGHLLMLAFILALFRAQV